VKKTLTILLFLPFLYSCQKDNSTNKPVEQIGSIVGKWNYKSEKYQVFDKDGTLIEDHTRTYNPGDIYFLYNADGTASAHSFEDEVKFTYIYSKGVLIDKLPNGQLTWTVTVSGKSLTKHEEYTAIGTLKKTIHDEYLEKQ
jgi:hypothetical protein